jgi:fructuronate reductase
VSNLSARQITARGSSRSAASWDGTLARLSLATLDRLPPSVRRPGFDVTALRPGILHLGCGAFHRAHQAVFTQQAIEAGGGAEPEAWGIIGASLRKPGMRDALQPQDGLYTVLERGTGAARAQVVGTVRSVVVMQEDPNALTRRFADPAIRVVTLTVTSSAYCLDTTGRLDAGHPDIRRDLQSPVPRSAIGVLVAGLAEVRRSGGRPPVVMSCDNLAANGRVLRQAAMDYAALHDDVLASWIGSAVQFPCSMVDRIVPSATAEDMEDAAVLLGLSDRAAVVTEPFRQWVIEAFDGPRPRWGAVGAIYVADVAPWEASKLRLLNGTHMALAYLGALAGLGTVSDVVAEPVFAAYASRFMLQEQMPTLPSSGHDIEAYARQLLERWGNPGIAHRLGRVGRNGSEKLQVRLLASIACNLKTGRPTPCTILAVAAWICCASGRVGRCHPAEFEDPSNGRMRVLGASAGDDAVALTRAALDVESVFGTELPRHAPFRAELARAVAMLQREGAVGAVSTLMASLASEQAPSQVAA